MSVYDQTKNANSSLSSNEKLIERKGIRWMLMLYDSILYFLCWFLFFSVSPSVNETIQKETQIFYFVIGYALFFCFRFVFRSYRRILRTANSGAFFREFASVFTGVLLLCVTSLLLNKVFHFAKVPFTTVLSFASLYALVSILVRVFYCYLYSFATKDYAISRVLRKLLEDR